MTDRSELWLRLCRSRWNVDTNDLHLPEHLAHPRHLYKFLSSSWRRIRRSTQQQQQVDAQRRHTAHPQSLSRQAIERGGQGITSACGCRGDAPLERG